MLSPLHKSVLLSTFLHIESRLSEIEPLLARGKEPTPLSQYVRDLSPTEAKVIEDYFARIRSTMVTSLERHSIPVNVRRVSLRWSLQTNLTLLSVAVAEMSPSRLRGYGQLDESDREEVLSMRQELERLFARVAAYLNDRLGHDLTERLARLQTAAPTATQSDSIAMLRLLDRVAMRWQLVEFRPTIDTIAQRLESPQLEVAVFGRVSSGKSSLLNHLAGRDVLPVGVTPVTTVPARLVRRESLRIVVHFAEVGPRVVDPGELAEYATEEKNRGNHKHVSGITVEIPSERLRQGVVLVDTPGVGSLAASGTAETFAYLPRCDLGVVLIDSGATLNREDLSLLRSLYEAGIPARVLLSKADLLTAEDRQRVLYYIRDQLRHELNLDMAVHPVSVVGKDAVLLDRWFEQEIEPLWQQHRKLTEESLQRKTALLRESMMAVLQTMLAKRQEKTPVGNDSLPLKAAERLLNEADAAIQRAQARQQQWTEDETGLVESILQVAAKAVVESAHKGSGQDFGPVARAVQERLFQVDQTAKEIVTGLQETLSRALEAFQKTAPLAMADTAAIRDVPLSGLPALDLSPLSANCKLSIPAWIASAPAIALWMARRSVDAQVADQLRQSVRLHNAQLRAWLKASVSSVVAPYQSQAEVFREQLRRMTSGAEPDAAADTADLIRDLRELVHTGVAEGDPAASEEGVHSPIVKGEGVATRSPRGAPAASPAGQ